MVISKFAELKVTGRLPSPSGVGMAILKLTQSDDYQTEDLTRTLQADPALTGRLLKMANAARVAGVEPFTTVGEATMRLGARTVRNVALSFSLVSGHRTGSCLQFDYDRFWSESLATAVSCQTLTGLSGAISGAEGFVLGLLCNVGRLTLASVHPEAYGDLLRRSPPVEGAALVEAERGLFEIDHNQVAHALLSDWELPEAFGAAAATFESVGRDEATLADLAGHLALSRTVAAECLGDASSHVVTDAERENANRQLGPHEIELDALVAGVRAEWEAWGSTLEVPTNDLPALGRMVAAEALRTLEEGVEAITSIGGGQGPRLRVLAVDDDRVSLRVLTRELEKAGHHVTTAPDGREGLRLAMEINPQVVVTDWQMPVMDGIEFCRSLRRFESGREMYVILLTGKEDDDHVVAAFDAGADDYVVKPFKPRVLMARVRAGERVARLQVKVARDQRKMQEQVAELGVLARRLEQFSLTDELTDLPNRRYAMERIKQDWTEAARHDIPMSVIMIDIDHFKRINDEFGHDAGDLVLRETADILRTHARDDETVCRIGGEEFLVLCRHTDLEGAEACAERLRSAVERAGVQLPEREVQVTISLGAAERSPGMERPHELLKAADAALYRAKDQGRNRVVSAR